MKNKVVTPTEVQRHRLNQLLSHCNRHLQNYNGRVVEVDVSAFTGAQVGAAVKALEAAGWTVSRTTKYEYHGRIVATGMHLQIGLVNSTRFRRPTIFSG